MQREKWNVAQSAWENENKSILDESNENKIECCTTNDGQTDWVELQNSFRIGDEQQMKKKHHFNDIKTKWFKTKQNIFF